MDVAQSDMRGQRRARTYLRIVLGLISAATARSQLVGSHCLSSSRVSPRPSLSCATSSLLPTYTKAMLAPESSCRSAPSLALHGGTLCDILDGAARCTSADGCTMRDALNSPCNGNRFVIVWWKSILGGLMVTIADVARRAGVAPSTVSNAFSGNRAVNAATRERILTAVEELGYRPNVTASNLRLRRTNTVGLAITLDTPGRTLSHGPFSAYIECIADRLNDHEYKLLCLISRTPEASELVQLARSGHVDGMILLQIRVDDPRLSGLQEAGLPFVAIGRSADARSMAWVDADLSHAAEIAVQHLLDLGHRRIALLGDRPVFGYQQHVLTGFRRAHRGADIPLSRKQLLHLDPASGLQGALRPFTDEHDQPTALITTADIEAILAVQVFAKMGLRVPDDVAVITLGDSVLTQLARPSITAVCCSVEESCRRAVDLLLALIAGEQPSRQHHLMPVTLFSRQSTSVPHVAGRSPSPSTP